jgi:hypothetical protein
MLQKRFSCEIKDLLFNFYDLGSLLVEHFVLTCQLFAGTCHIFPIDRTLLLSKEQQKIHSLHFQFNGNLKFYE